MILNTPRTRPEPWQTQCAGLRHSWLAPLLAIDWVFEWIAFLLSRWSFLEVLNYLGSFSILVAVIFYFSESGDRLKQKHYQAWQVINTAQGKGGSGGRIEALQELDQDGVPLVGVDVSGAFLQGIRLPRAHLLRADLNAVDARDSDFQAADFTSANLHSGNFRESNLSRANFQDADLGDADFCSANLSGCCSRRGDTGCSRLGEQRSRRSEVAKDQEPEGREHPESPQCSRRVYPVGDAAWRRDD